MPPCSYLFLLSAYRVFSLPLWTLYMQPRRSRGQMRSDGDIPSSMENFTNGCITIQPEPGSAIGSRRNFSIWLNWAITKEKALLLLRKLFVRQQLYFMQKPYAHNLLRIGLSSLFFLFSFILYLILTGIEEPQVRTISLLQSHVAWLQNIRSYGCAASCILRLL